MGGARTTSHATPTATFKVETWQSGQEFGARIRRYPVGVDPTGAGRARMSGDRSGGVGPIVASTFGFPTRTAARSWGEPKARELAKQEGSQCREQE